MSRPAGGRCVYDALVTHFPIGQLFRDLDSLPLGKPFPQALNDALTTAKVALIIIGPNWASISDPSGQPRLHKPNDFVRLEVEHALASGIPVIPVLVSHAELPQPQDLPPSLRPLLLRHGVNVRPDPDFHRDISRLISQLSSLIEGKGAGIKGDGSPDEIEVLLLGQGQDNSAHVTPLRLWSHHLVQSLSGTFSGLAMIQKRSWKSIEELNAAMASPSPNVDMSILTWDSLLVLKANMQIGSIPKPRVCLVLEEQHVAASQMFKDFFLESDWWPQIAKWISDHRGDK